MEALQSATIRAAQFLGVDELFGSVEEGKVANLVLLGSNPLADIRNTKEILLRGNFLDKAKLDELPVHQRLSRPQN